MDPHILAVVNIECPDDRYPKFKMCILQLILHSCEYTGIHNTALHDMTLIETTRWRHW